MINNSRKTRAEGKRARISDFGKTDQSQDLTTCRIYQNYKKNRKLKVGSCPFPQPRWQ